MRLWKQIMALTTGVSLAISSLYVLPEDSVGARIVWAAEDAAAAVDAAEDVEAVAEAESGDVQEDTADIAEDPASAESLPAEEADASEITSVDAGSDDAVSEAEEDVPEEELSVEEDIAIEEDEADTLEEAQPVEDAAYANPTVNALARTANATVNKVEEKEIRQKTVYNSDGESEETEITGELDEKEILRLSQAQAQTITVSKNDPAEVLYDEDDDSVILLLDNDQAFHIVSNTETLMEDSVQLQADQYISVDNAAGMEAAAKTVREQMKNRAASIVFYFRSSRGLAFRNHVKNIMDQTMRHTGVPNEGDYLRRHYDKYNFNSDSVTKGSTVYYTAKIQMKYRSTATQEKVVDVRVNTLKRNLGLASNISDYQKVRSIYDYLCKNVKYDYAHLNDKSYKIKYTAYACLADHTCVCAGYSVAFYRLALEAGVDTRYIVGLGNGSDPESLHAGNIVKLGGKYYNLDATWDAGKNSYQYFLLTDRSFSKGGTRHKRLGRSSSGLVHEFDTAAFYKQYPMATTDYNYSTSLAKATIKLAFTKGYCDGNPRRPGVTVTYKGKKLVGGTDYKVTYKNNINVGVAKVIVTGAGSSYSGTRTLSFLILPQKTFIKTVKTNREGIYLTWNPVRSVSEYRIYRNGKYYATSKRTYWTDSGRKNNGRRYSYTVYAYKYSEGKKLYSNASNSVSYYYLTRTGAPTLSYQKDRNQVKVTWEKNSQANGYVMEYADNGEYKNAKRIWMSGSNKTDGYIPVSRGTTIHCRIQAAVKLTNGKYCYSAYSDGKYMTIN